jgi:hypothetical protein
MVYAPAERASSQIHTANFFSTPICTLWFQQRAGAPLSILSELTILKSFCVRRVLGRLHLTNQKLDHSVHTNVAIFRSYMKSRHKRYYKQKMDKDMEGRRIRDHGKIRGQHLLCWRWNWFHPPPPSSTCQEIQRYRLHTLSSI